MECGWQCERSFRITVREEGPEQGLELVGFEADAGPDARGLAPAAKDRRFVRYSSVLEGLAVAGILHARIAVDGGRAGKDSNIQPRLNEDRGAASLKE
jgi:hypothetical protein